MTSTCGLWIAVRTRSVSCVARLPARDVQRGDDHVEARQQVVLVVEPAVGPDLELAAVQQPEAVGTASDGRSTVRLLAARTAR